jgi:hypothetical protein
LKDFNPKNWYWTVAGDTTRAFSSSTGDYVVAADPTFVAWSSDGTAPTSIDTEANLGDVLAPYFVRPTNSSVLDGYKGSQASSVSLQALFKMLFNHENRLRVLEGKVAVTAPQALTALKALM